MIIIVSSVLMLVSFWLLVISFYLKHLNKKAMNNNFLNWLDKKIEYLKEEILREESFNPTLKYPAEQRSEGYKDNLRKLNTLIKVKEKYINLK